MMTCENNETYVNYENYENCGIYDSPRTLNRLVPMTSILKLA